MYIQPKYYLDFNLIKFPLSKCKNKDFEISACHKLGHFFFLVSFLVFSFCVCVWFLFLLTLNSLLSLMRSCARVMSPIFGRPSNAILSFSVKSSGALASASVIAFANSSSLYTIRYRQICGLLFSIKW